MVVITKISVADPNPNPNLVAIILCPRRNISLSFFPIVI